MKPHVMLQIVGLALGLSCGAISCTSTTGSTQVRQSPDAPLDRSHYQALDVLRPPPYGRRIRRPRSRRESYPRSASLLRILELLVGEPGVRKRGGLHAATRGEGL